MRPSNAPEAGAIALRFDPYSASYLRNPYPFFAEARAATPIFYSPGEDCWVLTRHEDMRRVFLNPKQFSAANALAIRPLCPMAGLAFAEANFNSVPTLTVSDPPHHTRIRRLTSTVFNPAAIAALRPSIVAHTERFVTEAHPQGRAEMIRDFAWDLPAHLMFELFRLPEADLASLRAANVDPKLPLWGRPSETEQLRAARGIGIVWKFLVGHIAARAREPRDDFASDLLRARSPGLEPISEAEAASIMFGIMVASHETTAAMIVHVLRNLLLHRDAWEAIGHDPSLVANAIEEVLRFDSPVIGWRRVTTEPVEIAGTRIPAGATVLMLLGSANRDPAVFAAPDTFDIRRANASRHLSFGLGNHFCLGAPMARFVTELVMVHLRTRLPSLRLITPETPRYAPNLLFRMPVGLEVAWDA